MNSSNPDNPDTGSDDLQSYVTLMTRHQGNLRAFIVSLIPGSPEVDDVLQETNAALWQKRDRFEPGTNFLAWAFQIARYEVRRSRDRAKRQNRMVFSDQLMELITAESGDDDPQREQRIIALEGCLDKLTKNQREIIHYRYTSGLSLEQLSARNGRTANNLRVTLWRIRDVLKKCIERKLSSDSK